MASTNQDHGTFLQQTLERVSERLDGFDEKKFPKAVIYTKRHSVPFSISMLRGFPPKCGQIASRIEFVTIDERLDVYAVSTNSSGYEDKLVCFVPFRVERVGPTEFIARR